jgi:DNA-binding MarR family transcriptional regulator
MNLKHVSTSAMVKELLVRAEHMDALLALVGVARAVEPAAERPPVSVRHARRRGTGLLSQPKFLEALSGVPLPKTTVQLARQLKLTVHSVDHHMRSLEQEGKVQRIGNSRPALWARHSGEARVGPAPVRQPLLTSAKFAQALSEAPLPKTAMQLAQHMKLTVNVINPHLRRLEQAGKIRRIDGSAPLLWELVSTP